MSVQLGRSVRAFTLNRRMDKQTDTDNINVAVKRNTWDSEVNTSSEAAKVQYVRNATTVNYCGSKRLNRWCEPKNFFLDQDKSIF